MTEIEVLKLLNAIQDTLNLILETLNTHKVAIEDLREKVASIDAVLYNHKESIELLNDSLNKEYVSKKDEKVYTQ